MARCAINPEESLQPHLFKFSTLNTEVLRELSRKAGIRECWLMDTRGERIEFQILRHTARGYVATRPSGGWRKSAVFGKSFCLTRQLDDLGHPDFALDVR